MADTVVKTVENVDRLFSQIVVNGEVYESENYVAPTPSQSTPQTQPVVTPETQPSTEPVNTQGEDIYGVDLNGVLHDFVDDTVPDKIQQAVESLDVPSSGGSGKYIKSISQTDGKIVATEGNITDSVTAGSSDPVTGGAVSNALYDAQYAGQAKNLGNAGWYKIAELGTRNRGQSIIIDLTRGFLNTASEAHHIIIEYGWKTARVCEFAMASTQIQRFTKIKLCYNENNTDKMGLYVYYNIANSNPCYVSIRGLYASAIVPRSVTLYNFETDTKTWATELEFNLGSDGFYVNGQDIGNTKCNLYNNDNLSVTDCNDLPEGFYSAKGLTNRPSAVNSNTWVVYFTQLLNNNVLYKKQLCWLGAGTQTLLCRNCNNGTWTDWVSVGLPVPPTTDGNYILQCTVDNRVPSYDWENDLWYKDFTVDLSYNAGNVGSRGNQVLLNSGVTGFTPINAMPLYITDSSKSNVMIFFGNSLSRLYVNSYRTSASAQTVSGTVRVFYRKGTVKMMS